MERCVCGVALKRFWLWRDTNGVVHASGFRPTAGTIGTVIAATTRDALLPRAGGATPKHWVQDADDPAHVWRGRCSASAVGARATVGLREKVG